MFNNFINKIRENFDTLYNNNPMIEMLLLIILLVIGIIIAVIYMY